MKIIPWKPPTSDAETQTAREVTKLKGVARGYRKAIPFEVWKNCVLNIGQHRVTQYNISAKDHVIRTVRMDRLAVTTFDDKRLTVLHFAPLTCQLIANLISRWICHCGIHSLPYGDFRIEACLRLKKCLFCKEL
jgi:hypothetical protein